MPLLETKGAASAQGYGLTLQQAGPVYVEDVFSTFLYTGNGSTQTITNGIDLAGKGGLIWHKVRNEASLGHLLHDTDRGISQVLRTQTTEAQSTAYSTIGSVTNTGFTDNGQWSNSNSIVTWTFRKQPKFFDVVTYTGNGAANNVVAHNLQAKPRFVLVKSRSRAGNWLVYVSYPSSSNYTGYRRTTNGLQSTNGSSNDFINGSIFGTASIDFGLLNTQLATPAAGAANNINDNGVSYVVYMFAGSDAGGFGASGTENIVAAGTFTTGSGGVATVNLGWEPQWILTKSGTNGPWEIQDVMRGMPVTTLNNVNATLYANSTSAQTTRDDSSSSTYVYPTATGFEFKGIYAFGPYEYLAIRRPMKTPTTGTSVYTGIARTGTGAAATITGVGFAPDAVIFANRNHATSSNTAVEDKLRGQRVLLSNLTDVEYSSTSISQYNNDGVAIGTNGAINGASAQYINWFFRRAPGFFDVVCYTGNGSASYSVAHNLGVTPQMAIIKRRDAASSFGWFVVRQPGFGNDLLLNSSGTGGYNALNSWSSSSFTLASGFADVNASGGTYVAYLFATCPGVSKVGSYTGNGTSQTINCGFTAGARFVLIKRTDSTGDWYVWDTARGIVASNDPRLNLNSTAAEVSTDDSVDPDSTGFAVNQVATTNVNVSAATYIYLAVA